MFDRQGIVSIQPTKDERVMIGNHAGWRLFVEDEGGWEQAGPVYPTKTEAFAQVDEVVRVYY